MCGAEHLRQHRQHQYDCNQNDDTIILRHHYIIQNHLFSRTASCTDNAAKVTASHHYLWFVVESTPLYVYTFYYFKTSTFMRVVLWVDVRFLTNRDDRAARSGEMRRVAAGCLPVCFPTNISNLNTATEPVYPCGQHIQAQPTPRSVNSALLWLGRVGHNSDCTHGSCKPAGSLLNPPRPWPLDKLQFNFR